MSLATRLNFKVLALLAFFLAIVLRVSLWWVNPPQNAFDDHFAPIFLIMESGKIPAKDACWQCYHPPVFYWVSAMVGNGALAVGIHPPLLFKVIQFLPCLYGILTVGVVYLILRKLPLPEWSRLLTFGVVCVLPRHVYMSGMNSNDTISYLFVALTVYLLLVVLERKLAPPVVAATAVSLSIAIFTKYTAYAVLPVVLVVFGGLFLKHGLASRRRIVLSALGVLVLPLALLSGYLASNLKHYGAALPWNVDQLDPSLTQPRDSKRLDYWSFTPWDAIGTPMIVPGKMHSFWTLLYTSAWYDNEPKYIYFLDPNRGWWRQYYDWLRGEGAYPGPNAAMSRGTKVEGAALVMLGLVPLGLMGLGFLTCSRKVWNGWGGGDGVAGAVMSVFPTLLLANAAGVVALSLRLPVYSAAKATYLLASLPAFAVFLAEGLARCEGSARMKWAVTAVLGILMIVASVHILRVVAAGPMSPASGIRPGAGSRLAGSALDAIGDTPLVELRRVVPPGSARIVAKLESANPTGSMKDRMARSIVERAAADGRLPPGGTLVEYTAGTTGISLAFVCAALGYRAHFVFSDAFSDDKRYTMQAYGAEITDVSSDGRKITAELIRAMIATAGEIGRRPGHWEADQLNNRDAELGYHRMGEEIWSQAGGRVDAFVHAVSTAHSIHGAGSVLRRHNTDVRIIAVEPAESPVLSGGQPGSHRIEGIGIGFLPPLWRPDEVDEILTVSTDDAKAMTRRLAREEAIFAGTSTGANVLAALRVAERLGRGATVATVVVDSGLRYLSTDVFR
jgi:cysteine synthase A